MTEMRESRDGILIINKPAGLTSHDVVNSVRKKFHMRRVGHAGTLDPLATGVLVILLGHSTKLFKEFQSYDKAYRATLKLGVTTHTADIWGKILEIRPYVHITEEQIKNVLKQFVGEIEQRPPMVSAVKIGGQRLYKLARQGLEVERKPRWIKIHMLSLMNYHPPLVEFYVECSKGTYIRQLADDVGRMLGCGACITEIERTKVGPFVIDDAVNFYNFNESHIRHWP